MIFTVITAAWGLASTAIQAPLAILAVMIGPER